MDGFKEIGFVEHRPVNERHFGPRMQREAAQAELAQRADSSLRNARIAGSWLLAIATSTGR